MSFERPSKRMERLAPRIVVVATDARRADALARAIEDRPQGVDVHVARGRSDATAATRGAPARVIVLVDLHLDVPNAGLELVHHLARACPRAELHLLAPHDRFPDGIDVARIVDQETEPAEILDALLGRGEPTQDLDAPTPADEAAPPDYPARSTGRLLVTAEGEPAGSPEQ